MLWRVLRDGGAAPEQAEPTRQWWGSRRAARKKCHRLCAMTYAKGTAHQGERGKLCKEEWPLYGSRRGVGVGVNPLTGTPYECSHVHMYGEGVLGEKAHSPFFFIVSFSGGALP